MVINLFIILSFLLYFSNAGEISYSYSSDANLISTKQSEVHGAGAGDVKLFGGSIYQIAVGDVASSQVPIYQQDFYYVEGGSSTTVWSEQAVLVAVEGAPGDPAASNGVGYAIDAYDDILMASAPTGNSNYGGVFVYHDNYDDQWTQLQNLQPLKTTLNANFGYDVALDENGTRAIIGEPDNDYITTDAGAAYIFGAANFDKKTYWTQLQELYPENGPASSYFGAQVEMFGKYAAVTSPASCEVSFIF